MINSQATNANSLRGPGRPRGSNYSKRVTSFLSEDELQLISRIIKYGGDENNVATVSDAIRFALHKAGDFLPPEGGHDV